MPDDYGPDEYRQELMTLIAMFEYERCDNCGEDIDLHVIAPDVLGHPHLYCMSEGAHVAHM